MQKPHKNKPRAQDDDGYSFKEGGFHNMMNLLQHK